jgi:hypothetical protein
MLAVLAPLVVGLLVGLAVPRTRTKPAIALFRGYPMAIGFFVAFMIVVVTVPV